MGIGRAFGENERTMHTKDPAGTVISLNLGMAREVPANGRTVLTGIFKSPVLNRVRLGTTGFSGDRQADLRVHGGPSKAVYCYPSEHYPYWLQELGRDGLPWGSFGENLTTSGFTEQDLVIGDRFAVGSAVLQVSQPRMPCFKLAIRFGRADMVKRFWTSSRSGVYFSVVREGEIGSGDQMVKVEEGPELVTIADVLRLYRGEEWGSELRERALLSPLSGSWKTGIRERLTETSSEA
jgi:MOSC domain-containing protein YiiM